MSWHELDAAMGALDRLPVVTEERNELVMRIARTGDGPPSGEVRQRLAELAGELSRLHGELSDYYRWIAGGYEAADR